MVTGKCSTQGKADSTLSLYTRKNPMVKKKEKNAVHHHHTQDVECTINEIGSPESRRSISRILHGRWKEKKGPRKKNTMLSLSRSLKKRRYDIEKSRTTTAEARQSLQAPQAAPQGQQMLWQQQQRRCASESRGRPGARAGP